MADIGIAEILTQGGLATVAAFAMRWGYAESAKRESDRVESQRQITAERETSARAVDKERAENARLQAEIVRLATETAEINALNRATLIELKASLEASKRTRSAPK